MFHDLPLGALRAFEAAARLLSFKGAAAELHVTPTAVSHQIRALEQRLGFALFERLPRGVLLTPKGGRLFQRVHGMLLDLAQTLDALRPRPSTGGLTVSTTHSFAALWLVPRLGRFYQAHPGYEVRLDATSRLVDLLQDASVDVAIRYGGGDRSGRHRGLQAAAVLPERFAVYGAPAAVASAARRRPALISVQWRDSTVYETGWRQWCEAAGVSWLARAAPRSYEEENYALQAAIAGQGLVLASSAMVSDSEARGLLACFRPDISVPGLRYTALSAPGRQRHPPVRAFLDWLAGEFETAAARGRP
ncbi:LysR substrate-binding domain-containing protein, partial [Bordetella bronchiseptica]